MMVTGGCFCGAVRYQIDGPLLDARSCHCSKCRKAFSAQASAYALVQPDDFSWVSGESLLTNFVSQADFGLAFCQRCGSTLVGLFKHEVHGVTLGCVDGDPGVEIGMHIFVDSKAAWEVLPEGVLCYAEGPPSQPT